MLNSGAARSWTGPTGRVERTWARMESLREDAGASGSGNGGPAVGGSLGQMPVGTSHGGQAAAQAGD